MAVVKAFQQETWEVKMRSKSSVAVTHGKQKHMPAIPDLFLLSAHILVAKKRTVNPP